MTYFDSSQTLLFLIVCSVLVYFVRRYETERRFRQFAHANGCEPPVRIPDLLPWGIDRIVRILLFRGDVLDELFVPKFNELGYTFSGTGLFGIKIISCAEPKNIQAALALKFKDFELGEVRRGVFWPLLATGIFTADGPAWEHSRAMLRPQFSRDQISDLDTAEKHVQHLFQAISAASERQSTAEVELQNLFYRFTLDTATEFLFGTSVNSQSAALSSVQSDKAARSRAEGGPAFKEAEEEMDFAEAFTLAQDWLAWRFRFQGLYPLATSAKFRRSCTICHQYADQFVESALRNATIEADSKNAESGSRRPKYSLLDALTAETKDPKELRYQVLHILLAGRDTTASLLSWTFILLSRHPKVWERLQAEVVEQFGTEDYPKEISVTTLRACKYLQHVLQETLRLYPIIPGNLRVATRDTVLPVGGGKDGQSPIAIRKGTRFTYSVYTMHRRKDIWGPDANEFRPERWDGRKHDWSYLPFNGGPRICLGQQYALSEASFVVVRMLQRFAKIEATDGDEGLKKGISVTLYPANGVRVRLHRAQVPTEIWK
ncbi:MAG: hypothetical protein M1819_004932 [Sarea resinae]|nr:MAG: hypothetical protein M1819_004932 [Sarea resinae]